MGIIGSAIGAGFGQGMANLGAYMERDAAREEDRAAKLELARERLAASREAMLAKLSAGGGRGADPMKALEAENAQRLLKEAPSSTPTDRAQFTTKVDERTDPSEYSDAVSRKAAPLIQREMVDQAGLNQAEAARRSAGETLHTKLFNAGNFEGVQKGVQEQVVSELAQVYARTEDPKARKALLERMAELTNATGNGDRFKQADGTVLNPSNGETTTTDVGKSNINKNNASAGESSADAAKARAEVTKIEAEIASGSLSKKSSERLTTMSNSANTTIDKLNNGSKGKTPEEKANWQRQMDDAVALRDRATSLMRAGLDDRADPAKPAPTKPGTITPVKDNGRPAAPSRASQFTVIRN